ncbi:hypothetical protein NDU88_006742 [Pleurodeles waltl]|uniref:Uncharacterized protein n=1 Tax=Pleurodeles waltl TaxID=8319 RepID=A0AAV7UMH4_PLEWA|nr:hypothetical protein NDU88_006742 [Pleurodeles waltl]
MDPKVEEALALLRQAGRLDLVNFGALAPSRPARRASAGVAAAVAACSPPRHSDGAQVRGLKGKALREAGLGAPREFRGQALRGGLARGSPRASPVEGWVGGLRAGGKNARRGPVLKRYGTQHGARTETGAGVSRGRGAAPVKSEGGPVGRAKEAQAGSRDRRVGAEYEHIRGSRVGAVEEDKLPPSGVDRDKADTSGLEEQRDPKVPVSQKWPTMLVWSSSEEEGVSGEAGDSGSAGEEGPSTAGETGAPGLVYGCSGGGTSGEDSRGEGRDLVRGVGKRREGAGGFLCPSTPDLFGEGPLDFGEEDPGEQRAALVPWEEAKAGPWAASRMASSGRRGRRRRAADASSRRCGGVGDAPPDATAWEEQRPGSAKQWVAKKKGSMWLVLGVLGMVSRE